MSSTSAVFRETVKGFKKKMPAKSKSQYGLAQGVLHGSITGSTMPKDVAREIVDKTPKKKRKAFAAALTKHRGYK